MMPRADYRQLVGELAETTRRRDSDLAAAEQSYLDGVNGLRTEENGAASTLAEATARHQEAASTVDAIDAEAQRLWSALRAELGLRGRRLSAPAPSPMDKPPAGTPAAALHRVQSMIDGLAQGAGRPLPRRATGVLPFIGAICSVAVGLVAQWLAGTDTAGGLSVAVMAGWLALLAAPFAGLPTARWWARRAFGARLDTGGVGLTVLGGMVACTMVVFALH